MTSTCSTRIAIASILAFHVVPPAAHADDAPSLDEARAAAILADRRLAEADAIAGALFRVHNALGATRSSRALTCADDAHLLVRAQALGPASRDAVQAARVQVDRARVLLAWPTVAPLVTPEGAATQRAREERAAKLAVAVVEASAWHEQHLARPLRGCTAPWTAAPGLPGGERSLVAVLGDGVCPTPQVRYGAVGVVPGEACFDPSGTCSCSPAPVRSAAVVGPPPPPDLVKE